MATDNHSPVHFSESYYTDIKFKQLFERVLAIEEHLKSIDRNLKIIDRNMKLKASFESGSSQESQSIEAETSKQRLANSY